MSAKKPISRMADMASERPERAPNAPILQQPIGAWEPPTVDDRTLVRDGLLRNGALDGEPSAGPLALDCPTCAAVAGSGCRDSGGRDRYRGIHKARREAA